MHDRLASKMTNQVCDVLSFQAHTVDLSKVTTVFLQAPTIDALSFRVPSIFIGTTGLFLNVPNILNFIGVTRIESETHNSHIYYVCGCVELHTL